MKFEGALLLGVPDLLGVGTRPDGVKGALRLLTIGAALCAIGALCLSASLLSPWGPESLSQDDRLIIAIFLCAPIVLWGVGIEKLRRELRPAGAGNEERTQQSQERSPSTNGRPPREKKALVWIPLGVGAAILLIALLAYAADSSKPVNPEIGDWSGFVLILTLIIAVIVWLVTLLATALFLNLRTVVREIRPQLSESDQRSLWMTIALFAPAVYLLPVVTWMILRVS